MIQLVGLLVIATAGNREPYWVCAVYLVALAVAGIGAALFMDNLEQHDRPDRHAGVLRHADTWVISLLYIGTFGSFIGFSFAFGQVLQINFAAGGQMRRRRRCTPRRSRSSDRCWARSPGFTAASWPTASAAAGSRWGVRRMILAAGLLVGRPSTTTRRRRNRRDDGGYVIGFIALFLLSGIGNGSVYKMIPSIFEARTARWMSTRPSARH